jgi:hypothetical protein
MNASIASELIPARATDDDGRMRASRALQVGQRTASGETAAPQWGHVPVAGADGGIGLISMTYAIGAGQAKLHFQLKP